MNDLAFIDRYKEVRKRLNKGPAPKPKVLKLEQVDLPPPPVEPPSEDVVVRERIRMASAESEGISYRQALLRGCDGLPKRAKLAILPVLEETNYTWEELFRKSPDTKRNNRTRQAVNAKWEIFKIMHYELGFTVNRIATWCNMDHTSVFYGLGLLKKKRGKEEANDRDQQTTI